MTVTKLASPAPASIAGRTNPARLAAVTAPITSRLTTNSHQANALALRIRWNATRASSPSALQINWSSAVASCAIDDHSSSGAASPASRTGQGACWAAVTSTAASSAPANSAAGSRSGEIPNAELPAGNA